jgi:hypothetical protein
MLALLIARRVLSVRVERVAHIWGVFRLVLDPESASKRVIIDDVTHYAYGQTEDRSVELWVAGKAGWYNISPAKGYVPTFSRMVQAVDMLYFLTDRYQHGKKQFNPSFKNLCEQVGSYIASRGRLGAFCPDH